MENETQVLHMGIGEGFGKLLMNIAQEKVKYDFNFKGAKSTLAESLPGLPEKMALKLITGELKIVPNVETQDVEVVDSVEGDDYPVFNIEIWGNQKITKFTNDNRSILKSLQMRPLSEKASINMSEMFDLEQGVENSDHIFSDNEEYQEYKDRSNVLNKIILDTLKFKQVLDEISDAYPTIKFKDMTPAVVSASKIKLILDGFGDRIKEEELKEDHETNFENYIAAEHEKPDVIKPVNILDNWSAGYLAPNGDYYGMNGEIANMLHLSIADLLQEQKIIPSDDEIEFGSKDSWLEQNGWVKIHGNHILFDGYNLFRLKLKNIPLTEIQKTRIYEYGQLCHNGALKFGLKMEITSAARFNMIEPLMLQKLFEF